MVLVDTSVWIEFLDRFNPLVRIDLIELLRRREVATTGLVIAELRQGCRSPAQVIAVLQAMEPLVYHEVDRDIWLRAGELAADGSSRGHALKVGDCLIAAVALRRGWSVFTLDRDFERLPGLKLYRPQLT